MDRKEIRCECGDLNGLTGAGREQVADFCDNGSELSGSVKYSSSSFVQKNSAPYI